MVRVVAAVQERGYLADAGRAPVYLFDLDGTLIHSVSGRLFAQNASDVLIPQDVLAFVRERVAEGCVVAITTNQMHYTEEIEKKVRHAAEVFKVPVVVADGKGPSAGRKPSKAMWDTFLEWSGLKAASCGKVTYCGDAVGAAADWPPYRWSDVDERFARVIGATFATPREMFGGNKPDIAKVRPFDPSHKWLVVMVGNQGSGKSGLASAIVDANLGWQCVESDVFKSRKTAILKAVDSFLGGASVVADATHAGSSGRKELYALAKKHGALVRVVWVARDGRAFNKLRDKPIPAIAYSMYSKYSVDPTSDGHPVDVVI
jgi:DNA 3'-phosphatase